MFGFYTVVTFIDEIWFGFALPVSRPFEFAFLFSELD